MNIKNGKIILNEISGIGKVDTSISKNSIMLYRDSENNEFIIPTQNVIRLFSVLQFECERQEKDFEEFCNEIILNNE